MLGADASHLYSQLPKKMNLISSKLPIDGIRQKLKVVCSMPHKEFADVACCCCKDIELYDATSSRDKDMPKEDLASRYNRFVTLYNSNQDASEKYRSDLASLRKETRREERSARPPATTSTGTTGLDVRAHYTTHRQHFDELVTQARSSHEKSKLKSKLATDQRTVKSPPPRGFIELE